MQKIKLKTNHWLPKLLKVQGITLYPYILVAPKVPAATLLAHEIKHIDQVREVGFFRFYISYLLYYFAFRLEGYTAMYSYLLIPYEKEARLAEDNGLYLKRGSEIYLQKERKV
jgi:hypothetical protein